MRATRAIGVMMCVGMFANPALAVEHAQHTVAWYRVHAQARESILRTCENDHSYDDLADCRNAMSAAHAALSDSLAATAPGSGDPEADPAYYNAGLAAAVLSMCAKHLEPDSWCRAAQAASSSRAR